MVRVRIPASLLLVRPKDIVDIAGLTYPTQSVSVLRRRLGNGVGVRVGAGIGVEVGGRGQASSLSPPSPK